MVLIYFIVAVILPFILTFIVGDENDNIISEKACRDGLS